MLNKPKFMSPSTNMERKTIDAKGNTVNFSCIVDGNEAITDWQIIIYKLSDNSEVLNTEKQTLSKVFYPINEKNKNVVFNIDLKPYITENSLFVNLNEPYFWKISFWGNSGSNVTSCEEVFYANSVPTVEIQYGKEVLSDDGNVYIDYQDYTGAEAPIVLDSKKYYFRAVYSQEEGVSLKRFGWRIINTNDNTVLMDTITQNQIYGIVDNIVCVYDGFLSNSKYSVEVFIENQNNTTINSEPALFETQYGTTFLTNDFNVEFLKNENAVLLDWSSSVVIGGKMIDGNGKEIKNENISFLENYPISSPNDSESVSIVIPEDHMLSFDYGATSNLDIPEDIYVTLSTQLLEQKDIVLFDMEGVDSDGYEIRRKLSFIEGSFVYSILGKNDVLLTKTYTPTHAPSKYTWYVIVMSPILMDANDANYITLRVNESIAENGVYPQTQLYPSKNLYPSFGAWNLKVEGVE